MLNLSALIPIDSFFCGNLRGYHRVRQIIAPLPKLTQPAMPFPSVWNLGVNVLDHATTTPLLTSGFGGRGYPTNSGKKLLAGGRAFLSVQKPCVEALPAEPGLLVPFAGSRCGLPAGWQPSHNASVSAHFGNLWNNLGHLCRAPTLPLLPGSCSKPDACGAMRKVRHLEIVGGA